MLLGLPPEARIGTWVFEWYWNQPNVPHVKEFVAEIRKKSGGHVPTARTWFGFASIHTCALAAAQAQSLDAVKMAKAMQGFKLPPEVALMPDGAFFRAGQGQLIPDLYVGHAQSKGADDPEDLFVVDDVVKGADVAGTAGRDWLQDDVARLKLGKTGRRTDRGARNSGRGEGYTFHRCP